MNYRKDRNTKKQIKTDGRKLTLKLIRLGV